MKISKKMFLTSGVLSASAYAHGLYASLGEHVVSGYGYRLGGVHSFAFAVSLTQGLMSAGLFIMGWVFYND